jgi:poly(3-hydroxybutyrate) depolymerase
MLKTILSALLIALAASTQAADLSEYEIPKTWEKAVVYVPNNFFSTSVDSVKVEKPLPTVILMHGCGGITEHERRWADFIKSEGFIVVMPNSYAMPNRKQNCDPKNYTTNLGLVPVNELRPAEAEYAMTKLKEQTWADKRNIFLMGHSEGGMAAYMTPELGFNGVIISGFICTLRGGIRADRTTPVLAINWKTDPYFAKTKRNTRQCSELPMWTMRTNASELVLEGTGHATGYESNAREAVGKFLKQWIKQ